MKEVWVKVDPWQKELATTALEGGADAVMVASRDIEKVRDFFRGCSSRGLPWDLFGQFDKVKGIPERIPNMRSLSEDLECTSPRGITAYEEFTNDSIIITCCLNGLFSE